jgi:hypothetical protein
MGIVDTRELIEELAVLGVDDWQDGAAVDAVLDDADRSRARAIFDLLWEIGDEAPYGVTVVPDAEFVDYARELAEDVGAVPEGGAWPTYCIDWEWAARELRMDYMSAEFDGVAVWFRA